MKNTKNTRLDRLKALKKRSEGDVGDKGLATAARHPAAGAGSVGKLGLNPNSAKGTIRSEPNSGPYSHIKCQPPSAPQAIAGANDADQTRLPVVSDLSVSILTGDDGDLYHRFEALGRTVVFPSKMVIENRLQIMGALPRIGILAVSSAIKNEISLRIESAKRDEKTIVATRVGFEKRGVPRYFVYGDGTVISPAADLRVISLVEDRGRFRSNGELSIYEEGIADIIREQPVPVTLFFYALIQILKPFVSATRYKAENMMFELVGGTTTFKSALTSTLAGTVWGEGHSREGYARSWNMSDQAIEDLFVAFNDHLLILDEATLAHTHEKARADKILNAVHRLSSGQGRTRTGAVAEGHSVTMLSNSNQPMRSILSVTATEEVLRALEVRLISFQLGNRKTGFFHSLPSGYSSVDSAMNKLFATTKDNFGLLARRYILNVLTRAQQDSDALIRDIEKSIAKFMRGIILTDAVSHRRAQPFALAYAAAVIAFDTGTLKKEHWGKVKRNIRRAWTDYGAANSVVAGDERIVAYMSDTSKVFVDARGKAKPHIVDENFKKVAGIFYCGRDDALCLAVPNAAIKDMKLSAAALKKLKKEGVLRAGKSLQTKLALRRVKDENKVDVFYVFKVPEIPAPTKLSRDPGNK
ncbi:DUF927 domain-containing protein [Rhizobium bangladeshense]|uniref:DUF927 domain-containing protein n=1 Tax=Rhizobium bangladeshense TaxID=1138189 RepID=UPI001C830736|nr:DUF927 domain-containing protein [Rhizobium bangladeshense]MBX4918355.1 DUF927 domain-containing protein [Rhizobium bangladeshense]